ncbi:hypothetical protein [Brevibacillus dissolubilis]|uniref:hypothetical protein n=1 Tax=Brevibacillus dissolubilis TaxID=1844116 RepID=UPI0011160F2E|nr:hypothetical protein [Brevibacillus dissolubilis]
MDSPLYAKILAFHKDKGKKFSSLAVEIDEWTRCLRHRLSDEIYQTVCNQLLEEDLPNLLGWQFNWGEQLKLPEREVYTIKIIGDNRIQGLVSLQPNEAWVDVYLAESAPSNVGIHKEFFGVGPHLFAIACKRSFELGFDGYVAFFAKTKLIQHYITSLQAINPGGSRMIIPTQSAHDLVNSYFGGKRHD